MSLNQDEWLSNQLGRPAYHLKVEDLGAAEAAFSTLLEAGVFAYAKASAHEAVHFLT
jgi:hypothetical protein